MSSANSPSDSGRIIHEIQWSEALPWWILFRAAGTAFAPTVLLLAMVGSLALWAGWSLVDRMQLAPATLAADAIISADVASVQQTELVIPTAAGYLAGTTWNLLGFSPDRSERVTIFGWLPRAAAGVVRLVVLPFNPTATLPQIGDACARIGWFVLVWSIFGTAITRHVALKLIGEDAPGLVGSIWYGTSKWLASFNSVAFVLLGIVAMAVPGAILGLCMRTDIGLAVAGAFWPLVLGGAVVLAILAVGVVAGWPLMVAAVGVERGDSFQAISTAFSYLYQRPLHYAFYGFVAMIVLLPALFVAELFADAITMLAFWAASLGMGRDRAVVVMNGLSSGLPDASETAQWGVNALLFWTRGVGSILGSFGWGYFWAIATATYLLLRQDVDGTELDEVVLDEPSGESA